MSLLENELIRMYFGFECPRSMGCTDPNCYERTIQLAYKVVQAMEEPIKVGEKYLEIDHVSGLCGERVAKYETKGVVFNPWGLRLPSRFQAAVEKKGCQHEVIECVNCAKPFPQSPPAPAETEKCWCKPDQEACRSLNVCGCPCHKPSPEKCECGHNKENHQPRIVEPDLGRICCLNCQCGRYKSREDAVSGENPIDKGPYPDAVEKKIQELKKPRVLYGNRIAVFERELYELVALVRNEAKGR